MTLLDILLMLGALTRLVMQGFCSSITFLFNHTKGASSILTLLKMKYQVFIPVLHLLITSLSRATVDDGEYVSIICNHCGLLCSHIK